MTIKDVVKNINSLKFNKEIETDFPKDRIYWFSNEFNSKKRLIAFNNTSYENIDPSKVSTAIILGESNIISMAPELVKKGIELIISIDIEELLLENNKFMIECIKASGNRNEYFDIMFSWNNPALKNKYFKTTKDFLLEAKRWSYYFEGDLKNYQEDLYFLSSHKRFLECKKAVEKLKFITLKLDILNESLVEMFKKSIENCNIQLINITNLFDYQGNYPLRLSETKPELWNDSGRLFNSLKIVSENCNPVIMYSKLSDFMLEQQEASGLEAHLASNLNEYINEMNSYALWYNKRKCSTQSIICLSKKTGLTFFGINLESRDGPIVCARARVQSENINILNIEQKLNVTILKGPELNGDSLLEIYDINNEENGRAIFNLK